VCGLVGSFHHQEGKASPDEVLVAMRERMAHRGPDDAGLWRSSDGRCALAHRRLSIIDLSPRAAQPMVDPEAQVALVFNGEIYNHAELRRELEATGRFQWRTDHSDSEVLLYAYCHWGLECLHRLHGMFAFALYDARDPLRPVLHLVRDRVGIKPLYLTRTTRGEWLFASEIKALAAHPRFSPQLDLTAFWHYLTFLVAPAPLTLFRGVFKLPAGHLVTIDHRGRAQARRWWDCAPRARDTWREEELGLEEAVGEFTRVFRKAIAKRMVSDVPFGVLLSGGLDSSLNVALMSELMDRPVTTFSIGYQGHPDYNEFQFARRVARRFRTEHHEILISRQEVGEFLPRLVQIQDEPIADNVCIPLYFLARLVKQSGTTVVQVGEGADELFLGYWWCEHYRAKEERVYRPAREGRRWWYRLLPRMWGLAKLDPEDREIVRRARRGEELFWGGAVCWWGDMRRRLTPDPRPFRQEVNCPVEGLLPPSHRSLDSHQVVRHYLTGLEGELVKPEVLQKITYLELKLRLPEHLLMRVDKLTMAHAVEARVPYLDHEVVEFARRLPPSYKLRQGIGKYLIKEAAAPYLDQEIIHRPKQGFGAPVEQWMQEGDFGPRCLAAYQRSGLRRMGLFDDEYLLGLFRRQISHGGGLSFHLWTILNAVLWHEYWIEGRKDCF